MYHRCCDFEQYSSCLLLFFVCLSSFPFVSPTNLCSTSGLCCKHRDSECVAQRVYPNHTVDTSQLPCYCDHACIELEDCCPDYRQFCGGKFQRHVFISRKRKICNIYLSTFYKIIELFHKE